MKLSNLKRNAKRAIKMYGAEACIEAYRLNRVVGQGANTIATQYDLHGINTTYQADAAINAGEYLTRFAEVVR
jgi:hypothetical protein